LLPIVPSVSAQLICMQAVLVASLIACVAYKPLRVPVCNVMDVFFTVFVMFILASASCYTDSDPTIVLAWICALMVMAAILVFPIALLALLYNHCCRRDRKPFQFFVCHHKAGAGSFARLLKMQLEVEGTTRKAFIDCDHLTDLDVLFDTVASMTETLIIVASREVFLRLWCVGEITTAKMNGLKVVKLVLPDFAELEDDFIDNFKSHVPDLSILTNRGISLEDAQEAMRWSRGLGTISVPQDLSREVLVKMTKQILGSSSKDSDSLCNITKHSSSMDSEAAICESGSKRHRLAKGTTLIIYDATNLEATSTALILERLLRPRFAHTPKELPTILPFGSSLPSSARKILLICTNGVLEQESVISNLALVVQAQMKCLPVVADDSFRFPTPSWLDEGHSFMAMVEKVIQGETFLGDCQQQECVCADKLTVSQDIVNIFKTIGVKFPASSGSQAVLTTRMEEIASRLDTSPRRGTTVSTIASQSSVRGPVSSIRSTSTLSNSLSTGPAAKSTLMNVSEQSDASCELVMPNSVEIELHDDDCFSL